jgi:hypothetical protein
MRLGTQIGDDNRRIGRALSQGGGVQTGCIWAMVLEGDLPKPNLQIWADTGWEPDWVYAQVLRLEQESAEAGVAFVKVGHSNLRTDALCSTVPRTVDKGERAASIPYFTKNADGSVGRLKRQCTKEYKLQPINAALGKLRRALGWEAVEVWIGISIDEAHRMKDPDRRWKRHYYPLIERRMNRSDCIRYLESHGYSVPYRSACVGCPYRSPAEWRTIRDDPALWRDAVAFDEAIRHSDKTDAPLYLTRTCQPLIELDLDTPEEKGQLGLWGDECEGLCGV